MTIYKFCDTDDLGFAEYDIDGEHHKKLIETCFKYCASYSWRISGSEVQEPGDIAQFQIPITSEVREVYSHYYRQDDGRMKGEVRHYLITPETISAFMAVAGSMFKWVNAWGYSKPEDPAFYREDGSVFFYLLLFTKESVPCSPMEMRKLKIYLNMAIG